MADAFLAELNRAVARVPDLPRVHFRAGRPDARKWLDKKHADDQVHEPATIAAFLAVSERYPIERFWDVGAHFGYFTLVAQGLWPEAQVVAMDMHPGAVRGLAVNAGPHVPCLHMAVSDVPRKDVRIWISGFNIYEEPEGGWDNLPSEPGAMKERGAANRGRGFAKVDFVTLDKIASCVGAPDLIKIDVEGYQAKAILGARDLIAQSHPIIVIELHDLDKLTRFGTSNKETVQPLFDAGYRGYWCGNHRASDAKFERVTEMGPEHERLSIMAFVPD